MDKTFFLSACLAAAVLPGLFPAEASKADLSAFPGWPQRYENVPLEPLLLSEKETYFEAGFPGRIGRFRHGNQELVLKWVAETSRKLHPVLDCYQATGYQIEKRGLMRDTQGKEWLSFRALRDGRAYNVREIIRDQAGNSWSDISSWYWASFLGNTQAPWWVEIVAEPA